MVQKIKVFTNEDAVKQRGADATEMLWCENCKDQAGVFISETNGMDSEDVNEEGEEFVRIVWEKWGCLHCPNNWVERYAVGAKVATEEDKDAIVTDPLISVLTMPKWPATID